MFSDSELLLLCDSADRLALDIEARGYDLTAGPTAHHQAVVDLGWYGLLVDPDHGGFGGSARAMFTVMEAMGRSLVRAPYLSSAVMAASLLERDPGDAAQATLMRVMEGRDIATLADREPGDGHALRRTRTLATRTAGGFRLDGRKTFVLDAPDATHFLVTAQLDDGTALFLVPAASAGLGVLGCRALDGRAVGDLVLQDVPVPESHQLAGITASDLARTYDLATLAVCAEACGIVAAVNAKTLEYLKTRRQFGTAIGNFQALQHRMSDMYVDEQLLRAVTLAAADQWDAGTAITPIWISAAKAHVSRLGRILGESAVQLHGGIGVTEEYIVGHYLKRLLVIANLFGDERTHLDRIGWISRDEWNA